MFFEEKEKLKNHLNTHYSGLSLKLHTGNQGKALALISVVDQPLCENENFESAFISHKEKFKKTTYLIVDAPQIYNLSAEESVRKNTLINFKETSSLSMEAADLGYAWWIKHENFLLTFLTEEQKNKFHNNDFSQVLDRIKKFNEFSLENNLNCEFLNWDMWTKKISLYSEKISTLESIIKLQLEEKEFFISKNTTNNIIDFKTAFNKDSDDYAKRKAKGNSKIEAYHKKGSLSFLLKESVSIIQGSILLEYAFILYPGKILDSFQCVQQYCLETENKKNLAQWINVWFKPKKNKNSSSIGKIPRKHSDASDSSSEDSDSTFSTSPPPNGFCNLHSSRSPSEERGAFLGAFYGSLIKTLFLPSDKPNNVTNLKKEDYSQKKPTQK